MICFFASTKFQIITAINIVLQNNLDADLYVINEYIYINCQELANKVKYENIFRNVRVIETDSLKLNRNSSHINTFFLYCNCSKIVKSFLIREDYQTIYYCTNSITERLVRFYFCNKNGSNTQFVMYDEGASSYMGTMEKNKFPEYFIRYILFGKKSTCFVKNKCYYAPEFYYKFDDYGYEFIKKIQHMDIGRINIFNRIFEYNDNQMIKENIIFLGTIQAIALKPEAISDYENLLKNIAVTAGSDFIIKKHPADKSLKIDGIKYCDNCDIPFEIVAANSDISKKALISLNSTAVVTPKLLFDQEPVVILFYKLFAGSLYEWKNDYYDIFFQNVKKSYRDQEKFYIPETFDELKKIIMKLGKL